MKTTRNHSFVLGNWRKAPSLEPAFLGALKKAAVRHSRTPSRIVHAIDAKRLPKQQLSGAIRVWILEDLLQQLQDSRQHASELRIAINKMINGGGDTPDGLAPVDVVIAGARANG